MDNLTENEVRENLKRVGLNDPEIQSKIDEARAEAES